MNIRKRGIGAYQREKRKGHDLDFDGEKDIPIIFDESDRLKAGSAPKSVKADQRINSKSIGGNGKDVGIGKKEKVVQGLLKSGSDGNGYKKAARFLLVVGKEQAAKIIPHFTQEEIEGISREIAKIQKINRKEEQNILAEFGLAILKPAVRQGGLDVAREILVAAFGEKQGEHLLEKVFPNSTGKPFGFLNDLEFHQIVQLLKHEPVSVISIILPNIDAPLASKVLESLPPESQKAVISRIAKLEKIDKEVLLHIEGALKDKIRKQGRVVTEEINGKGILADILKFMPGTDEASILGDLDDKDPELAKDIREKLFSSETVLQLEDQDLQMVLRDFDDHELSILLKGKDEKFLSKIFTNISARRNMLIREEMEFMGPIKKSEADTATKEFLQYLQTLVDEGKILLRRKNDRYIE